jgi:hypothetical protein
LLFQQIQHTSDVPGLSLDCPQASGLAHDTDYAQSGQPGAPL